MVGENRRAKEDNQSIAWAIGGSIYVHMFILHMRFDRLIVLVNLGYQFCCSFIRNLGAKREEDRFSSHNL